LGLYLEAVLIRIVWRVKSMVDFIACLVKEAIFSKMEFALPVNHLAVITATPQIQQIV
jgi:hypothetical protein